MTDLIMTVLAQNRQIKSVKLIRGFLLSQFLEFFGKEYTFLTNNRINFIKCDSNIIFKNKL